MINTQHLSVLRKVIDAGFVDEKAIISLTTEEMIPFCKTIADISAVVELQKAIKTNHLISFLADDERDKK